MVLTLYRRKAGSAALVAIPRIAPITQRTYSHRSAYGGTAGTTTLSANVLYGHPFFVSAPLTADRIAVNVTTAAAAGKLLRLGLYAADTTDPRYPGALLVDSGALEADTAAPFIATSAAISVALTPGLHYFLALVTDGVSMAVTSTTAHYSLYGGADASTATQAGVFRVFSYAALPATWGTPSGYSSALAHINVRAA